MKSLLSVLGQRGQVTCSAYTLVGVLFIHLGHGQRHGTSSSVAKADVTVKSSRWHHLSHFSKDSRHWYLVALWFPVSGGEGKAGTGELSRVRSLP